ncbi:hypothetical protein CPB83DRAFT_840404 [Crepidotus variabilis]|uniref:Uncharacterized protein n=1 Tax=Crepidotus variabilis TaxID=179855 RepID=A0A9P6E4Q1_9AGAR|nr:hypothetical protein CPB83DRAFT_840404 [Crepidotus variabilis]
MAGRVTTADFIDIDGDPVICGDPSSLQQPAHLSRSTFLTKDIQPNLTPIQSVEEVPVPWKGRIVEGAFVFIDNPLLCHITGAPLTQFLLFDPREPNGWVKFEAPKPLYWPVTCVVLLKAIKYDITRCIGLQHFMRAVHRDLVGAPEYPTPPVTTSSDDEKMLTEDEAEDTDSVEFSDDSEDETFSLSEDEMEEAEALLFEEKDYVI